MDTVSALSTVCEGNPQVSWGSHSEKVNNAGLCLYRWFVPAGGLPPMVPAPTATMLTWWRHQMVTYPALLALCAGNSSVIGEFPAQRPVTWSFGVFFFIYNWINGWVNNRDADDLRRNRVHYDVTVITKLDYVFGDEMTSLKLADVRSSDIVKVRELVGISYAVSHVYSLK